MTDMRLNDHGAVVTGGASGIGAAIVRRFVAEHLPDVGYVPATSTAAVTAAASTAAAWTTANLSLDRKSTRLNSSH